ncbi:glycosyltransferase family 2 protein [Photobacterium phosphoreum]|uniref:glycosyltransferase family 2 protein n=1 Tax=Photobacterium phosphoreum TaxID=659 RepID=UPI000D172C49|nr:glycosyltransferase family A protein [Photobacterium phosphoreum]PSU55184.1 glycosyltransferase family 2 protein [Photobacterium phosphoreum]
MKISVIIPVYNSSSTIIKCLESVNHQVIESANIDIEIIIVNDGSTDDTLHKINIYKSKVANNITIFSKENGGVSSARNLGINKSTGEWIAFLDSDDIWMKDKIQKQIDIINNIRDVNFIGCARNNEKLSILGKSIEYIYEATCNDLLLKMFPQTSTALVKKSTLDSVGYYNESMTHSEDGELWIRICSIGGFYYLPESLVLTGDGKENFGESGLSSNLKKMHQGTIKMLQIAHDNKIISKSEFFIFNIFYHLKYIRRVLMVKMRK